MRDKLRISVEDALGDASVVIPEHDKEALSHIRLGSEVAERLGPVVMEYLENALADDKAAAAEVLVKVDPTDVSAVIMAQQRAQAATLAMQWLADAIYRGIMAEQQIRNMEDGA